MGRFPEPAGRRPAVVVQHDRFNRSKLNTVVVAAITSNLKYAALPGNVRLRKHEGGLPSPSVVNVTQLSTLDRMHVLSKLGQLSNERLRDIWGGLVHVLEPRQV